MVEYKSVKKKLRVGETDWLEAAGLLLDDENESLPAPAPGGDVSGYRSVSRSAILILKIIQFINYRKKGCT